MFYLSINQSIEVLVDHLMCNKIIKLMKQNQQVITYYVIRKYINSTNFLSINFFLVNWPPF